MAFAIIISWFVYYIYANKWSRLPLTFIKRILKDGDESAISSLKGIKGEFRYIGKLFERILAKRLEIYLKTVGILDENQEGFSKGKNTVRYIHRLTAGIKGDIMKKLTVLCLFINK